MKTSSSSFVGFNFAALEAAYLETMVDLAPQVSQYALEAARKAELESIDEEVICGVYGRRYFSAPDNSRFEAGFWGGHPIQRSHNESKSKRTMIRKRGRV